MSFRPSGNAIGSSNLQPQPDKGSDIPAPGTYPTRGEEPTQLTLLDDDLPFTTRLTFHHKQKAETTVGGVTS
jgi:hypothetical protein